MTCPGEAVRRLVVHLTFLQSFISTGLQWVLAMRLQAVSTALWLRERKTVETVSIFSAHDSPG
jgi:hypothetical protein